jgi:hypothetical protein
MTDLSPYIIGALNVPDGYNGARADCHLACDPAGRFWAIPIADWNPNFLAYSISDATAARYVVALR